jgi:hypothetical protein
MKKLQKFSDRARVPVDASFFAKLRDAQNLPNPNDHWIGGLKSILLESL